MGRSKGEPPETGVIKKDLKPPTRPNYPEPPNSPSSPVYKTGKFHECIKQ